MSRHGMQAVELVDERPVVVPLTEPPRRVARWWWVGVAAVVVVAALVGTQSALDARQRAAFERFAAVPGVVAPVGPGVQILWRPPPALVGVVLGGLTADGAFVGLSAGDDGSQAVVAVDERTGDVRWSTAMSGPDPTRAAPSQDPRATRRCALADAHEVACLVGDGSQDVDVVSSQADDAATTTRVVVLDTRDGRVLADHPAPAATSIAVLPGLAVLSARGSGVTAQDLRSGAERWHYTPKGAGQDLSQAAFGSAVQVFAAGDLVGVTVPGWSVALLDASGDLVRTPVPAIAGYRYDPATGGLALLSTTDSGQVRSTMVRTGRADVDLPGNYLDVAVDDGSVPDLVLTSDTSLRGWDARTGASRWASDEIATGSALVVHGRVYVPTMNGTVALDGRSGKLVWRSTVTTGHVPGSLATDGTTILVADQPINSPGGSVLVAYGLDDGRLVWQAPLPAGIRSSAGAGRALLGLTTTGVAVLG